MGGTGLTRGIGSRDPQRQLHGQAARGHYPVLFKGKSGRVAHEFVVDCRAVRHSAGIKVEDIAKRLMDYGFHAPR
jgi:glycine dehydrogenase